MNLTRRDVLGMAIALPAAAWLNNVNDPEGPGLGLDLNEDRLRSHLAKGETWWG